MGRQGTAALSEHIMKYFFSLFLSEVDAPDPNVLASVKRIVTQTMNNAFLAPYSTEELKKAMFNIGDLKA